MRFEVFTSMKREYMVFWVVASCSMVVGCQYFRGQCCFCLQGWNATVLLC